MQHYLSFGNSIKKVNNKDIAAACLEIANNLIRSLGMDAITETSMINRIWRNLYTAAQHGFLTP